MTNQQAPESTRNAEKVGHGLLSMPKPSVRLRKTNETALGRFVRCAVNLAVALLIVASPLAIAYLMYGLDGFHRLFFIVVTLFLIVAMIGLLVSVFVIASPGPAASLARGQYFTRWQLNQDQQQIIRRHRRRELWKHYVFATVMFGLTGIGVGSGNVESGAVDSNGEVVHIVAVVLGCTAIGSILVALMQFRNRGVNGLAALECNEVVIGPAGIYVAGEHRPWQFFSRVYQTTDAVDELQFEFREPNNPIKAFSVPYPMEQRHRVGQLQSLLNEHEPAALGMLVAEASLAATKNGTNDDTNDQPSIHRIATYSYKLNASPGLYNLRLTDHSIEVFDEGGTAVREIEFSAIKYLYEYDGINASDPGSGGYKTEFCQIKAARWKSLTIRNGSYLAPNGKMGEFSTNQHAKFDAFMQELKLRIAAVRPNVSVETGSTVVVLICGIVVLLGLFVSCIAFAPAETIGIRITLVVFSLLLGVPMLWLGSRGTRAYWPRRKPVGEFSRQDIDTVREMAKS